MGIPVVKKFFTGFLAVALFTRLTVPAFGQDISDVLAMDLHQLMQMDVVVTSVSKRPQKLHETASAIFVVTQEDIRRTGAVNLMEALRIVPGLLVSKINQNVFAISVRGFNRGSGSDKLLVLIDGRSVYSPVSNGLNKGVQWVVQDVVLEDVDRIEVIRGPGAALWGSNAVAGVINIITKSSAETQGVLAATGAGTEERAFGTLRYGGKVGEKLFYRVYGKYRDRDEGELADGSEGVDDKQMAQAGFRSDVQINPADHLTLQGDYYDMDAGLDLKNRFISPSPVPTSGPFQGIDNKKGGNLLSRWTRELDAESSFKLQAYYDYVETDIDLPFHSVGHQADVEFQHNFLLGDRQNFSWGMDYRFVNYKFDKSEIVLGPGETSSHLFGAFVHDEIALIPKRWNLILGVKLEDNEFSGFEYQPNVRTVWTPNESHTLWAAFSRAVRIPNALEEEGEFNRVSFPINFPPVNPDDFAISREKNDGRTDAEELLAYEAGYKYQAPSKNWGFDIAAYYFDYDNLIEFVVDSFTPSFDPNIPWERIVANDNVMEGEIYGVELGARWQVHKNWLLALGYTYQHTDFRPINGAVNFASGTDPSPDVVLNGEPRHIFNARSYIQLPNDFELDTMFYYVDENTARNIPSYERLDVRLGWRPAKEFELSLVGQNLLDPSHPELNELVERDTETERSFYAKATFRF